MRQRPTEPIETPHDQGVASPKMIQQVEQFGTIILRAACDFLPDSIAAGLRQSVSLQIQHLIGATNPQISINGAHRG